MRHLLSVSLVLIVLWLLNSGQFSALLLGFGLLSVLFVVYMTRAMGIIDEEGQPLHLFRRLPAYFGWLIKEIVKSSITVSRLAWKGGGAVSPRLQVLPISQKTDLGKVIYANSLTLTPGTVVVDLRQDSVVVHSLTDAAMKDVQGGVMDRKVRNVEGL